MTKVSNIKIDEKLKKKSNTFIKRMSSDMYFMSELNSDSMSFDWLDEIEAACPYIDNIIKNPKMALIKEEEVVKIEKAKKITVASIKDLARNTHYIEKIDELTNEVKPSKILIERNEETFNTYENRFIYTLVDNIVRFILRQESLLSEIDSKNDKVLEYAASTLTGEERVNIELKISAKELPKGNKGKDFNKEIKEIKLRVRRIKDYIASWRRSEFIKSLEKAHASFITPPIRKTNMILKNPNFQVASKLWGFLQTYDDRDNESLKTNLDTTGDNVLKGILDDSFLMNYFVLDSICASKKEQKDNLTKYAAIMINQQIQRVVSLMLNSGLDISAEEILSMISNEIKQEKSKRLVGSDDVKNKFKNAMEEYLKKTQDYL